MDKNKYVSPREYEMLTILLADQGEEETKAAIDKMLSYITGEQGTIDSVAADSPWGRRRLAYPIRHEGVDYRDGHYVLVYFTAMPNVLAEVERELKLDTNVIRYLLLTQDPHMGEKIDPNAIVEGADAVAEETSPAAGLEATDAPAAEAEQPEATETEAVAEVEESTAAEEDAAVEEPVAAEEEAATVEAEAPAESAEADVAQADEVEETVVVEETTEEAAAEGDVEKAAEE